MRQAGHEVVYKDFTKEVNERLRVYDATMRINRLEHIKAVFLQWKPIKRKS